MLSTFPSPATQGWVTAHNKLFGSFVNSHLLGKYHLFLIICSIHIIDFILPALSHTLLHGSQLLHLRVWMCPMPFFPVFFLAQSPLPSPGTSPVRVYLTVSFPQGFHLPSLQGFLESSTDTGPLTKGCSTHSFHTPSPIPLSLCLS